MTRCGNADYVFTSGLPTRLRAAAMVSGTWTFGPWVDRGTFAQGPLVLTATTGAGDLLITAEHGHGFATISTSGGWNVSELLAVLGVRTIVSLAVQLRIGGLPHGLYAVTMDGQTTTSRIGSDGGVAKLP